MPKSTWTGNFKFFPLKNLPICVIRSFACQTFYQTKILARTPCSHCQLLKVTQGLDFSSSIKLSTTTPGARMSHLPIKLYNGLRSETLANSARNQCITPNLKTYPFTLAIHICTHTATTANTCSSLPTFGCWLARSRIPAQNIQSARHWKECKRWNAKCVTCASANGWWWETDVCLRTLSTFATIASCPSTMMVKAKSVAHFKHTLFCLNWTARIYSIVTLYLYLVNKSLQCQYKSEHYRAIITIY